MPIVNTNLKAASEGEPKNEVRFFKGLRLAAESLLDTNVRSSA
jgi:hypothetical protein